MALEKTDAHVCFGGEQLQFTHESAVNDCTMTFSIYLPPQAKTGPVPAVWWLSGLTCTDQNFVTKAGAQGFAAEYGLAVIAPDTSPRGDDVPDDQDNWQFGSGAGFYLDATQEPWRKNYKMYSYLRDELPQILEDNFNVDMKRQGVFGHSMGGHGALTMALKNPETFKSCSAFAPIVEPSTADWSSGAFARYLGEDKANWRAYDATALVEDGNTFSEFLIDQGQADGFLDDGLRPWLFEEACKQANIPLKLRMQPGYDHSYFFISTFMEDHIKWHADRL